MHLTSSYGWTDKRYWAHLGSAFVFAMNIGGISISGVGLLAVSIAPLPFALLGYHLYLIWAGMTTNESAKWADWQEDMHDGVVWRGKRSVVDAHNREREARHLRARNRASGIDQDLDKSEEEDEHIPWPKSSDQTILRTTDGRAPTGQEHLWEACTSLDLVDNIYDIGFWPNLIAVLQGR